MNSRLCLPRAMDRPMSGATFLPGSSSPWRSFPKPSLFSIIAGVDPKVGSLRLVLDSGDHRHLPAVGRA